MRFLLVSVSGSVPPQPIEIQTLDQLLSYLNYEGEENDLIISPCSLVSMAHDRIQRKGTCSHVLCLYDDFIEPKAPDPKVRKRLNNEKTSNGGTDSEQQSNNS